MTDNVTDWRMCQTMLTVDTEESYIKLNASDVLSKEGGVYQNSLPPNEIMLVNGHIDLVSMGRNM